MNKEQYLEKLIEGKRIPKENGVFSDFSKEDIAEISFAHVLKGLGKNAKPEETFVSMLEDTLQKAYKAQGATAPEKQSPEITWSFWRASGEQPGSRFAFAGGMIVLVLLIVSFGILNVNEYRLAREQSFVPETRFVANLDLTVTELEGLITDQEDELAFFDADLAFYESLTNGAFEEMESDLELIIQEI
jgi:hypothetical protein